MKRSFPVRYLFVIACAASSGPARAFDGVEARKELFAARYENAVALYSKLVEEIPADGDAWYGLVRADLGLRHSRDAYAAAEQALSKAPQSAGAQAAEGLAMYRRGDLAKAEAYFRAALKIDPNYPGALTGLASVDSAISMVKSARDLRLLAWAKSPDDPQLMAFHADTLKGGERIAALEEAMARLDPASAEARDLRVHIANDRAAGSRRLNRLASPYKNSDIKLFPIMRGSRQRGFGVHLLLNQKETVRLILDPGSSGISVGPKVAAKAGLRMMGAEASEARGYGDRKAQPLFEYLASEVRAGDVIFADYPVSVFQSALDDDTDGSIGPDVFRRFLVKIDYWRLTMSLEARPEGDPGASDEPVDWAGGLTPGFYRVFRFGDRLAIPTSINGTRARLFLIDSGGPLHMIDTETAKEFTELGDTGRIKVKGTQGVVNRTSWAGLASLAFAGFRLDRPEVIAISLEKMSDSLGAGIAGAVNLPIQGDQTVTFDYRSGSIRIENKKP